MMQDPSLSAGRLTRAPGPCGADATLQNLLKTTTAKLELCERLGLLEYEANLEGHEATAAAFHELAATEQAACCDLLRHLRRHLEETIDSEDTRSSTPPG